MSHEDTVSAGQVQAGLPGGEAAGGNPQPGPGADPGELIELRYPDLAMLARQTSLLPPLVGASCLPLGDVDPEVLERLAAELIRRRPNRGAHFYGRRGQKQYGLDILERENPDENSVYQVRRYQVLTPDLISSAVTENAGPGEKAGISRPAGLRPAGTCWSPRRRSTTTPHYRTGWTSCSRSTAGTGP